MELIKYQTLYGQDDRWYGFHGIKNRINSAAWPEFLYFQICQLNLACSLTGHCGVTKQAVGFNRYSAHVYMSPWFRHFIVCVEARRDR